MIDVLIKNERGTAPIATARSNDAIGDPLVRVTNLDPASLIVFGREYMVGLDDNTNMHGRTCTALEVAHGTAEFS